MIWEDELDDMTLIKASNYTYIVGRALFAADNTCIFDHTYATFLQKTDISFPTDQFYMWVIETGDEEICMEYCVSHATGIIVLELLRKDGIHPCNSLPVGILLFLCSAQERDEILYRGWFTKQHLLEDKCRIVWFDEATIMQLSTDCEILMKSSKLLLSWEKLGRCISLTVSRKPRHHETVIKRIKSTNLCEKQHIDVIYEIGGEKCVAIIDFFVINTSLLSVLAEWAQCAGVPSTTTDMNHIEQLWLFFHVNTRGFDRNTLQPHLFHTMCQGIHSHAETGIEIINCLKISTLSKLCIVGMNKKRTAILMQQYTQYLEAFEYNTLAYQSISDEMKKYRQKYNFFQIYVSHRLDTFTTKAIQIAPLSVFDREATQMWVSRTIPMLKDTLCMDAVCEDILKSASVKVRYGDLLLYSMLDDITKELGKTYNISTGSNFKFETKHGILSTSAYGEPTLFWNKEKNYVLPWNSDASHSHRRCMLSSNTRTPIWLNWPPTRKSPTHSWLIPSTVAYAKDVDSVLEDLYEKDGYVHEMINPYMHVSNLILDVDIKPLHPNDSLVQHIRNIQETFIKDMCHLIQYVLFKLLGTLLKTESIHCYVFESKRSSGGEEKIGFHIHVALPGGIVFANKVVCQDLVKILNNVRVRYPKTLGLISHNLFDVAIYGSSNHALRGPYQRKSSGKDPLCCVYRTDKKPLTEKIPLHHQFVHGYHICRKTNKKLLQGPIVTKLQGFKLLDDAIFLRELGDVKINNGINSLCSHEIEDIMDNINNKCVVFTCKKPRSTKDIKLLEKMANELWNKQKNKIQRIMHSKDYLEGDISYIANNTKFKVNDAGLSLVDKDTFRGKFSICLRKNHRLEPSNVMYRIKYGKNMIKMIMTASCFKDSCHGLGRFPGGNMEMMPVFLTPCIKNKIDLAWCEILKSHPVVRKIVAGEDNSSQEIFETNSFEVLVERIGSTCQLERLFAISIDDANNNRVLAFRSQYRILVLFIWNEIATPPLSLIYTCTDPMLFIKHIKKTGLISSGLFDAISNTLRNDGSLRDSHD